MFNTECEQWCGNVKVWTVMDKVITASTCLRSDHTLQVDLLGLALQQKLQTITKYNHI